MKRKYKRIFGVPAGYDFSKFIPDPRTKQGLLIFEKPKRRRKK